MQKQAKSRFNRLLPLVMIGLGVLVVGVVLFNVLNSGAAGSANGGPKLAVDKQEINLGDVKLGQTVSAAFTITNTGSAPLRFTEAPYIELKEGC